MRDYQPTGSVLPHQNSALIGSLPKLPLLGLDKGIAQFINDQTLRGPTPGSQHCNSVTPQAILETMMCPYYVDAPLTPASTHRRRRIEWPSLHQGLLAIFRREAPSNLRSPAVKWKTKRVLEDEFMKCSVAQPTSGNDDDAAIVQSHVQDHRNDFGPLLKILYWRGRQQSAVFDVFIQLLCSNYVRADSLCRSMHTTYPSKSVSQLTWLLACFEGPARATQTQNFEVQDDDYLLPLRWLATIIIRSGTDIDNLLNHIMCTGYLGKVDLENIGEFYTHCGYTQFERDPEAGSSEPGLPSGFGFWLPHGVSADPRDMVKNIRAGIKRFNHIEECFQMWFQLSPTELYTEKQQKEYYEAHPDEYPE